VSAYPRIAVSRSGPRQPDRVACLRTFTYRRYPRTAAPFQRPRRNTVTVHGQTRSGLLTQAVTPAEGCGGPLSTRCGGTALRLLAGACYPSISRRSLDAST